MGFLFMTGVATNPRDRDDISMFLVHLTRDYKKNKAENNLLSILSSQVIEARNYHCLFGPKIKRMRMTDKLKRSFKTVCFTETPLNQLNKLASEEINRKIKLKPYGLVFWRSDMVSAGANPAIYVNGDGACLREYLISEFNSHFSDVKSYVALERKENFAEEIIKYYSIINLMAERHDFSWEREWRYNGDYAFDYASLVAIIAENPDDFLGLCEAELHEDVMQYVRRIPIISPTWSYEGIIDAMARKIWMGTY